jgi:hypothetical protein
MVPGPDRRFVYAVERMEWEGEAPAAASAGLCIYGGRPDDGDGDEDEERGVPEWWSRVVCLTTAVLLK